eukprot:12892595-Prorocentrum_lima.AAC.1
MMPRMAQPQHPPPQRPPPFIEEVLTDSPQQKQQQQQHMWVQYPVQSTTPSMHPGVSVMAIPMDQT